MSTSITTLTDFKHRYPIRPYDPAALLGSGSYGKVVKVEDQLETEWVAVKISDYKGNDSQSLRAEVELVQRIPRQANIARYDACYRLETDTGMSDFAVMKYYHDGNLATLLKHSALTPQQTYDLTKGILLGLQHLHRQRIVHRDFKPANILISRDNQGRLIPKIADFGLSKLVDDEAVDHSDFELSDGRGTPSYKAPEQIQGGRVSYNLDLWAFGVVLYEMLLGEKPFGVDTRLGSEQAMRRSVEVKIVQAVIPAKIEQVAEPYRSIIKRCLVRDMHQRARRADELLDLLDHITPLLAMADDALRRGNYTDARRHYETILQRNPTHAEASRGLAECIAQGRPGADGTLPLAALPDEPTDVFQEDPTDLYGSTELTDVLLFGERTDVLTDGAPPLPNVPDSKAEPISTNANVPSAAQDQPVADVTTNVPDQTPTRSLPWRWLATAAAVAGVGIYLSVTSEGRPEADTSAANGAAINKPTSLLGISSQSAPLSSGEKPTTAQSTDLATVEALLKKARTAFYSNQYAQAIDFAERGLQLSPRRADLMLLRSEAKLHVAQAANTPQAPQTTPAPTVAVSTPVAEPTTPVENATETEQDKARKVYEQLLEQGAKAISNGNRKTDAIAAFTEARQLADKHNLSTTSSRKYYQLYLDRGNRIFERDEWGGALLWYQVAQAVDNTSEVRSRIKTCTQNQ